MNLAGCRGVWGGLGEVQKNGGGVPCQGANIPMGKGILNRYLKIYP